MTQLLKVELIKIMRRRSLLIILIITCLVFPLSVKIGSYLVSKEPNVVEGLFVDQVSSIVIIACSFILFLPMWVSYFVGQEFDNGYVNRVTFLTSRKEYFFSKIIYCILVSLFFTFLASVALLISVKVNAFPSISIDFKFVIAFTVQVLIFNILNSLTILCITFAIRKPKLATAIVYLCNGLDNFVYNILDKMAGIKAPFLRIFTSLFSKAGGNPPYSDIKYYNPLLEEPTIVFSSVVFVSLILCLSYIWFLRRDLKPISD